MERRQRPRVVIIGAGFGGLECARRLRNTPVDVLLLDRNNYHLFTPLLYQVASSLLNPSDIAQPVRAIIRGAPNVRFRQATATGIDFAAQQVLLEGEEALAYDYVVVAVGSTTNYFGMASLEAGALGLKDLPEALELRNHIIRRLEEASRTDDPAERARLLSFAVIGGGPTGVEYAGALSELVRLVIPGEYPELRDDDVRILLVEALPALLTTFPEDLGGHARDELERRGIEVVTGVRVVGTDGQTLELSDGSNVPAGTVIWAAGVKPEALTAAINVSRSRSGRIEVDGALRLVGLRDAFAIGDAASVGHGQGEVPMLSAPAIQEARAVAANILRDMRGQRLRRFRYRDRGSMATIGRNAAVASIGPLRLRGFVGWIAWLAVHLYFLIGFRNRLLVLLGWGWNYLRFDRPVRIIARARTRP